MSKTMSTAIAPNKIYIYLGGFEPMLKRLQEIVKYDFIRVLSLYSFQIFNLYNLKGA